MLDLEMELRKYTSFPTKHSLILSIKDTGQRQSTSADDVESSVKFSTSGLNLSRNFSKKFFKIRSNRRVKLKTMLRAFAFPCNLSNTLLVVDS